MSKLPGPQWVRTGAKRGMWSSEAPQRPAKHRFTRAIGGEDKAGWAEGRTRERASGFPRGGGWSQLDGEQQGGKGSLGSGQVDAGWVPEGGRGCRNHEGSGEGLMRGRKRCSRDGHHRRRLYNQRRGGREALWLDGRYFPCEGEGSSHGSCGWRICTNWEQPPGNTQRSRAVTKPPSR